MKICILGLSLTTNYGGILQNYALQKTLKDLGHSPLSDNFHNPKYHSSPLKKLPAYLIHSINSALYPSYAINPKAYINKNIQPSDTKSFRIVSQEITPFIDEHIAHTNIFNGERASQNKINDFDAIIIGSDQVWNPQYLDTSYSFLQFCTNKNQILVAYAASFGDDKLEGYTPAIINKCANSLKNFDAISVRETSAEHLCSKFFNIKAQTVFDPTLLLEKEDYLKLTSNNKPKDNILSYYILDKNKEKENIACRIASKLNLNIKNLGPKQKLTNKTKELSNCIFPSISSWLSGFRDASFVVTDSFHGVIFSIIFNKPFICINNKKRGSARFVSLFKIFDLQNRLIESEQEIDFDNLMQIDFDKVNEIKSQWKNKSIKFLEKCLNAKKQ